LAQINSGPRRRSPTIAIALATKHPGYRLELCRTPPSPTNRSPPRRGSTRLLSVLGTQRMDVPGFNSACQADVYRPDAGQLLAKPLRTFPLTTNNSPAKPTSPAKR
jgi:hypothetical protein